MGLGPLEHGWQVLTFAEEKDVRYALSRTLERSSGLEEHRFISGGYEYYIKISWYGDSLYIRGTPVRRKVAT